MTASTYYYAAVSQGGTRIRGMDCGHRHRTPATALACADRQPGVWDWVLRAVRPGVGDTSLTDDEFESSGW